jgi:PTH2 family peptidyl-tRNA hydrolase
MKNNFKLSIIVRMDLGMSVGKMIAQACHAAVEANEIAKKHKHSIWKHWKNSGGKKIALKCDSLDELKQIEFEARKVDIIAVSIIDAGHTEIPAGTETCIAIGPDTDETINKITRKLDLI